MLLWGGLVAIATIVAVTLFSWRSTGASHNLPDGLSAVTVLPEPSSTAFVGGSQRSLLNRRGGDEEDESPITMHGGARRNNRYNYPKKLHPRYIDYIDRKNSLYTPFWLQKLTWKKEPTLEIWSQTLKLYFLEGEDDVVTEDEVMEYFTTDEYKPEACVVGHQNTHEKLKTTYVHFATNEDCKKARKEKDGGPIGKATEVRVVFSDEKKWIRLRDGVRVRGGFRASWMRAYGTATIPEFWDQWDADSTVRQHPTYPE